jgi:hypothetical protein
VDYLVTNVPTGLPPTDGTRLPSHVAFGLWALGYSPRVNFSLLDPKGNVLFCGNVQKWMDKRHEFSRVNDWRASA